MNFQLSFQSHDAARLWLNECDSISQHSTRQPREADRCDSEIWKLLSRKLSWEMGHSSYGLRWLRDIILICWM